MMLMHALHVNGILTARANGTIAQVDPGVYTLNVREILKKSSVGYQN